MSGSVYASAETRYALLFGVNNYPNLGPKFTLQKAVNDAANLGDELRAMQFLVDVVPNPTYQDMLSKIVTLANRVQLGDTVLVFFSGHGVSPDGNNLLMPSDMSPLAGGDVGKVQAAHAAYAEYSIIHAFKDKLTDATTHQQKGLIIFISDACRNNPFDAASVPTKSILVEAPGVQPKITAGIFSIYGAGIDEESLDRLPSDDPIRDQNSVFMRVFLKHAREQVPLDDVIYKTKYEVAALAATAKDPRTNAPYQQNPAYYNGTIGEAVYLAGRSARPPGTPVATAMPPGPSSPSGLGGIPEKPYKELDSRDIYGFDYDIKYNTPFGTCVEACRSQYDKCVAFSYDKWKHACYLKNGTGPLLLEPNSLTGIRLDMPIPASSTKPVTYDIYRNTMFLGDTYRSTVAASYNDCHTTCDADRSCVAFAFGKVDRSCKMFKSAGEHYQDVTADSGVKRQEALP